METRPAFIEELKKKVHYDDRISNLSDDVIYHILSFLPAKSIAQMSLLSTRWKILSSSSPYLDFSDAIRCPSSMFPTESITPPTSTSFLSKLLAYLTRACRPRQRRPIVTSREEIVANYQNIVITSIITMLSRRQGSSNIKVFRIGSYHQLLSVGRDYVSVPLLHKCIALLLKYHVEELELMIDNMSRPNEQYFSLPQCVYECESLRSLTLQCYWMGFSYFGNDGATARRLQSLRTLSLFGVEFMDSADLIKDLFSAASFPSLEMLALQDCRRITHLKIHCPSLKYLTLGGGADIWDKLDICGARLERLAIRSCHIGWGKVGTWVEIVAPKLQTFIWEQNSTDKFLIHSSPTLKTARISCSCTSNISNLFSVSSHVQQLCLSFPTLQVLTVVYFQGGPPCSFPKLQTLEIDCEYLGLGKHAIPGLAYLLKSSPQLQTLKIRSQYFSEYDEKWNNIGLDDRGCSEEQYWDDEAESLSPSLCELTSVNIDVRPDFRISKGMISLIRFVLGHAGGLQELRVRCSCKEDLNDTISLIEGFPRASANVKIYFVT